MLKLAMKQSFVSRMRGMEALSGKYWFHTYNWLFYSSLVLIHERCANIADIVK